MTTIVPINPPLWVTTPLGEGEATFLIDRGPDHHLQWVVWINATGECWTLRNPEVRRVTNLTMGRDNITPFGEQSRSRFSFAGKDEFGDDKD